MQNLLPCILGENTKMLSQISIPKPCHQDWNEMIPNTSGRHCSSCAKTVVDFTQMHDEDVRNYLLNNLSAKVCGRFRNDQVQRITIILPADIFEQPLPLWKRFLVAGLLTFSLMLFSCDSHVQGDVAITEKPVDSLKEPPPPPPSDGRTMGLPAIPDSLKKIKPTCIKGLVVDTLIPEIMGEVALAPAQTKDKQ